MFAVRNTLRRSLNVRRKFFSTVNPGATKTASNGLLKYSMLGVGLAVPSYLYLKNMRYYSSEALSDEGLVTSQVAGSDELPEGTMKEFQVGDDENRDVVLVCRVDGKLY